MSNVSKCGLRFGQLQWTRLHEGQPGSSRLREQALFVFIGRLHVVSVQVKVAQDLVRINATLGSRN